MKIFIFIYVTLFSFISSSIVFAEEKISELRCEMKNYRLNNYSKKWGLSWVPENYNVSFFSSNQSGRVRGKTFKITLNDKDKIKFEYKQTHKNQSYTVVKHIYFKSKRKLNVSFNLPGGFRNPGDIWGTCNVQYYDIKKTNNSSQKSVVSNSDVNNSISVNADKEITKHSDYVICVRYGWKEDNLKYILEAKRRGLACVKDEEKAIRDAKIKAEQLAEEKAQRDARIKAEKLAQEKAKRDARIKAEKLVQEKAKRDAQIKAQKLAKEKAKLKAQKLAEEKAKIKNDTLEHVNMIQDIEVFSSKQNIFDPIKIGTLFVKLNNSKKNKWTINSSKVYRELKKYVFSFNEFKDFREQRKQNRLNIENESLDILSKNLNSKISLLKEYISKNLRSKNIPIVIEFISKIEKELAKKNVKSLKILNQKVQEWISKNIKNSKTKNKTKTIKTEDRQTIPLSKDNSIRFDLLSSAIISKEFGDGFSNYEANKNNYLCGLILKINNVSKKSYNTKDLNFRVTFDSNRVLQEAKDVSQALTLQEGLDNIGGTTLKPGANYSTGIGFILPSTELDTKYILLEVLKNKKIIFQQKILPTKN